MSDLPPVSGKVGLDVTDFKTALSEMNRDIRVIESGFRATAASLGDWGSSVDGLEARISSLTEEIGIQKNKVEALKAEYEKIREEKGENSRAAEELEIKLNREREALGKMQNELETSEGKLDELKSSSEDAGKGMDELERETGESRNALEKLEGVANGLQTGLAIGIAAIAGLAAAVVGVGVAIGNLVFDAAEAAAELVDLSLKTGISTERLQELSYISDQVGASTETITSSLARMTRSMDKARKEQAAFDAQLKAGVMEDQIKVPIEMARAFNMLGVNYVNSNGTLRDSEQVFYDLIAALSSVESETDRDAIAMQIFGRSAMELNPLIRTGTEELMRLSAEAHKVGAVMSEETVADLEEFDDSMASLRAGLKGTLGELAHAFLPGANELVETAQTYLGQFSDIVRGADGDLVQMAEGIGNLIGNIAQDIATRGPEFLQAGLNIIQGILDAVTKNLPQMVDAAAGIITSLMRFLTDNLPSLIRTGLEIVLALVNAIIENLPELVEAGIEALIALIEGLSEALPELVPKIVEAVTLIIETLLEHLPELIEAGGKLLLALVEGLAEALPILIEKAPDLIEALADALIELLPILAKIGLEMLKIVAKAIVDNLPLMGEAAVELVVIFDEEIRKLFKTIVQVGKDIVNGIWEGIKANKEYFLNQIEGFFTSMIDAIRESLGIHSPSSLFAEIGENAGLSYINSMGAAIQKGTRSLEKTLGETAVSLNLPTKNNQAALPAQTTQPIPIVNQFYLTAQYPKQSPASLAADIRLLQMMYGEA